MLQIFKAETYCARSKWAYGLANLHETFLTRFRSRSSHFLFILLEQIPMPAKQLLFFFDWEILISGQVRVCSALMKSAATQRPEQLSSFDSGVSILSFLLTWSFLQVAPGKTLYTQSATVKLAAKCADFTWLATRRTDRNECAETPWNRNSKAFPATRVINKTSTWRKSGHQTSEGCLDSCHLWFDLCPCFKYLPRRSSMYWT